jgi:hypothetical protein
VSTRRGHLLQGVCNEDALSSTFTIVWNPTQRRSSSVAVPLDRVHRYQLDVEVEEHTEQPMKYFLLRTKSDEMRQPSIKISHLEALKSGDKSGAQPPAHDDSVRSAGHSDFLSRVASIRWDLDADGRLGAGS